ncbi:MAG: sodium:calcium antiporter [Thermodesulfovibrionales bacterium]|nr:sodium:calcium antiporter [Thermodesulfovibrionales bacterium]
MIEVVLLLFSLLIILFSAEVFTNGVECLGRHLSLSQAVVGSIFAAVGTALPETILPFVAIMFHQGKDAHQIGVGAILGAPFMLSTLAFFLVGLTVLISYLKKRRPFIVEVEISSMKRDIIFFLIMYSTAIFIPMIISSSGFVIAVFLIIGYLIYAFKTFRGESEGILHSEELYLNRVFNIIRRRLNKQDYCQEDISIGIFPILTQVALGLVIMIAGAHIFVSSISKLSQQWGLDPLLFALLIAPVATELPEKFNSVTWTFKGRDTLALGNITGAMVFQTTFPVSLGLIFTSWKIDGIALLSAVLAIISAVMVLLNICITKRLSPITLLMGCIFYMIYAGIVLNTH